MQEPRNTYVDLLLTTFTKYTDGQTPRGMLSDIASIAGVSREYVRQRSEVLGLVPMKEIDRFCLFCGKSVKSLSMRVKYCSQECREKQYIAKYMLSSVCQLCGKTYMSFKRLRIKQKFCSKQCYFNSQKKTPEVKVCLGCGKTFTSPRRNKQIFCSHYCYLKNQSNVRVV